LTVPLPLQHPTAPQQGRAHLKLYEDTAPPYPALRGARLWARLKLLRYADAEASYGAALLMMECGRFEKALLFAESAATQLRVGSASEFLDAKDVERLEDGIAFAGGLTCCHLHNATHGAKKQVWTDAALHWFDLLSDSNPDLLRVVLLSPAVRELRPCIEQLLFRPLSAEVA
jgi:hypothetical protein